jgi:hypothetical protein
LPFGGDPTCPGVSFLGLAFWCHSFLKLYLSSAASSGCESLVIMIFLPLRCFSSVVFLLENPAREQQKCAGLSSDLLERRTGQIEHAVQIERTQTSAFPLEVKLTSLSLFTLVTQLCSTQQKPPVSASSSVLIYCDWCFGCFDFQVLVCGLLQVTPQVCY